MAAGRSIMKVDSNWTKNNFLKHELLGNSLAAVWLPRPQFQSLVGELISCKPEAETNKQTNKQQKTKPPNQCDSEGENSSPHLLASLPVFNLSFLFQLLEQSCSHPVFITSPMLLKKPVTLFCLVDQSWTPQLSIWSPSTSPKGFVLGPFEQT